MTPDVVASGPAGAVPALARREAWRTVRHPVYLVLLLYFGVLAGVEAGSLGTPTWETVRDFAGTIGLLWVGPATFFAANLVSSSGRRAHADSQLAATPTSAQARTLAVCLGVLGPTAAATGLAGLLWLIEHAGDTPGGAKSAAELAVIPLCALGGGLLGVAVAQWLPWRGAALVVMFTLIAWVVAVFDRGELRWTAPWSMSGDYAGEVLVPGSHGWHAVYLLGLALLAAVAALLRHPPHRRPLLALGALLGVGTLTACWMQLA